MDINLWFTLFLSAFVISIFPASGALNSINQGMNFGFRKSIYSIIGLQIGYLIQIFTVCIGLASILMKSILVFNIIKYIGSAYLIYLGIRNIMDKNTNTVQNGERKLLFSHKKVLVESTILSVSNPKGFIFLISVIPQFMSTNSQNKSLELFVISVTLILMDTVVMLGYSFFASRVRVFLSNPKIMSIQNKIIGGIFILAGIFLLKSEK